MRLFVLKLNRDDRPEAALAPHPHRSLTAPSPRSLTTPSPLPHKRAGYIQSLLALAAAKEARPSLYTKTSLMLGLGESDEEVRAASEMSTVFC